MCSPKHPDIKALVPSERGLLDSISPALSKYHETQFSTVKLPGSSDSVLVSQWNSLGKNRYFDSVANSAFDFDPATQKASNVSSHALDSQNASLIKSLHNALRTHADEHYPAATVGVFPAESDSKVALVLVSNKYSPNNFWFVLDCCVSIITFVADVTSSGMAVGALTTSLTRPPHL